MALIILLFLFIGWVLLFAVMTYIGFKAIEKEVEKEHSK
jgi:hypothetical protein